MKARIEAIWIGCLLLFGLFASVHSQTVSEETCPVCYRVIRAVKGLGTAKQQSPESDLAVNTKDASSKKGKDQRATATATAIRASGWDDTPVRGTSFEHYCSLGTLSVEELKFCYDTDSFKKDILKLLDFGADEQRICKRVYKENPNFCSVLKKTSVVPGTRVSKNAKGIIYE